MIWFDATQSDQPEITWMSSVTGLPFGSISLLPLYVKPAAVSSCLRRRRVVRRERLRLRLHGRVGDPLREQAVRGRSRRWAARSRTHRASTPCCGRSPCDSALRNATRLYGYCVLSNTSDDRVGRRRVERVEVRLVLRLVRLGDVRDEVVRPVDLAALDQRERGVVRRRLDVLEAGDERLAGLPVVRVLAQDVVLRR